MQLSDLRGLDVLLVEDEPLLRRQIAAVLTAQSLEVAAVGTLEAAKRMIEGMRFDLAVVDVNLPDGLGTDLLKDSVLGPDTATIIMTAQAAIDGAVDAIRLGAMDYLVKPFDPAELPLRLARARQARQAARLDEHRRAKDAPEQFLFGNALKPIEQQLEKIVAADRRVQGTPAPVLILGETGTGKTTIARWVHRQGPRAQAPLVEVNCSALPESLAESELFGHERGAFTDARTARLGLFEAANGGTLFLDELPSLSATLQAKVLTSIEDHTIRRLGGNKPLRVDVRIIAASNRDLRELVAQGQFREDLYHRLDLFRLHLPPLRARGDDIHVLAETLLANLCRRHRLPVRKLSATGLARLMSYAWPGNVRELAHELERAIVFSDSSTVDLEHLPPPAGSNAVGSGGNGGVGATFPGGTSQLGFESAEWLNPNFVLPEAGFQLEAAIDRLVQLALKQANDNVSAAARLLGVSRDVVRYRLEKRPLR